MFSTQEKLLESKDIQKEYEEYFGMYVALDNKDRLISFGKDEQVVFNEAMEFNNRANNPGFRLYKIHNAYTRQLIKCLLDDTW